MLVALTAIMGVLIFAGTVLLAVMLVKRASPGGASGSNPKAPAAAAVLDEPAGTRIAEANGTADVLVLLLSGAGPDRVVVIDPHSGRVSARVELAR